MGKITASIGTELYKTEIQSETKTRLKFLKAVQNDMG